MNVRPARSGWVGGGREIDADVAVVGAGPAGSALAAMLGRAGVRTVLLDRARFPRDKPCGEGLLPAGVSVLEEIGVSLRSFPTLGGVSYRVPLAGSAKGDFVNGTRGLGVRRLVFDQMLAAHAQATPNVEARFGCDASGLELRAGHAVLNTDAGHIGCRFVIGADGLHSRVAGWMGWARAPRSRRFGLVGHLAAPRHGVDRVIVTLGRVAEVYSAPTGPDELLVAVLASKGGLRDRDEPVREAYARHVRSAHPELSVPGDVSVHGAGPFWVRPSRVAAGRVFLLGDAAGFLDPLTGDGMSDALVAARKLASLISSGARDHASDYRRWERGQWRRRLFVNRLALTLTGSSGFARRALRGLQRRPSTLNRLLEINDGTRRISSLSLRDWTALVGV
jgi:flavin-dependent dehydrogenase